MKKILITGGLGYVGSRLTNQLSVNHHVIVSTRKADAQTGIFAGPVSFISHESLLHLDTFPKVDTVVHLAALNEIDSVAMPALAIEVNINQTRIILEHAIAKGVVKFMYFSTAHVYGNGLTGIVDETTLTRPVHPYSITHRAAEDYVLAAHEANRTTAYILRLSNSFGRPMYANVNRWTLLVNDIVRQAVTFGRIKLNSNGSQYRDFIPLTDVISATEVLINRMVRDKNAVFNISTGRSMTVMEMSRMVSVCCEKIIGQKIPILLPENATPGPEQSFTLSSRKIKELGIDLSSDFTAEIDELVHFCLKHFKSEWTS